MDLSGAFLLHTAPGVRKLGRRASTRSSASARPRARAWCASPSRSARSTACARSAARAASRTRRSSRCSELGMVYFAIVGGAAALETTQIEEIEEVAWEELMPECLWKFRVKDFGPLTVGIDAHGNSLFHDVQERSAEATGGNPCPALTAFSPCPRARPSRASAGLTHVIDKGLNLRDIEGALRHRRRLRRHRQARLGHVATSPATSRRRSRSTARSRRRSSAAARSSRPSTRATGSTSTSAG